MCNLPKCSHSAERQRSVPLEREEDGSLSRCPSRLPVRISPDVDRQAAFLSERAHAKYKRKHEQLLAFLANRFAARRSYLEPPRNTPAETPDIQLGHHVRVPPAVCFSTRDASSGGWMERVATGLIVHDALGTKAGDRFIGCGTMGTVHARVNGTGAVEAKLHGSRCRSKVCPRCAKLYSERASEGTYRVLKAMQWPSMVTLTVSHEETDSLRAVLDKLFRAWDCLRRTQVWRQNVLGAVRVLEVKKSETKGWHPHLHILVDAKWLPRPEVVKAWKRVTGGSTGVFIERVKSKQAGARYVAKYVNKSTLNWNADDLFEFLRTMKGIRVISTLGWCRSMQILGSEEKLEEEEPPGPEWKVVGSVTDVFALAKKRDPFGVEIIAILFGQEVAKMALGRKPPPPKSKPKPIPHPDCIGYDCAEYD